MAALLHSLTDCVQRKSTIYFTHKSIDVHLTNNFLSYKLKEDDTENKISLNKIRRIVMLGVPSISSVVLYRLMRCGIAIDYLDVFGKPLGQLTAFTDKADNLITKQENFYNTQDAFNLAKAIILSKLFNSKEVIRQRILVLPDWQQCENLIIRALDPASLRGAEGYAARVYFDKWNELVAPFTWRGRFAFPATDPVNMLLSFGYGLLHNRFASALRSVGLNPRLGFFHQTRGRHCALASDLMEPFRAYIDRVVLKLIRLKQIKPEDFIVKGKRYTFKQNETFSLVLNAFEQMFDSNHTMYYKKGNEIVSTTRTLNNFIEDLSFTYAKYLNNRAFFPVLRSRK